MTTLEQQKAELAYQEASAAIPLIEQTISTSEAAIAKISELFAGTDVDYLKSSGNVLNILNAHKYAIKGLKRDLAKFQEVYNAGDPSAEA